MDNNDDKSSTAWCSDSLQILDDLLTPAPDTRLVDPRVVEFERKQSLRKTLSGKHRSMDPPAERGSETVDDVEFAAHAKRELDSVMEQGDVELSVGDYERQKQAHIEAREMTYDNQDDAFSVDFTGPIDLDESSSSEVYQSSSRKPSSENRCTSRRIVLLIIGVVIIALAIAIAVVMTQMRTTTTNAASTAPTNADDGDGTSSDTRQKTKLVFWVDFVDDATPAVMSKDLRAIFEAATGSFFAETLAAETEATSSNWAASDFNVQVYQQEVQQQDSSSGTGNRRLQSRLGERDHRVLEADAASVLRIHAAVAATTKLSRLELTELLIKLVSDHSSDLKRQLLLTDAGEDDEDYFASIQSISVTSKSELKEEEDSTSKSDSGSITDIEPQTTSTPTMSPTTSPTGAPSASPTKAPAKTPSDAPTTTDVDVSIGNGQL
ncbi:hypothetical protein MPSEU_000624200 [Mayamaea pseudoterrestris]|nr:hypothetical protein MPSEU_000624200 [Mayamaea pseudoterrestris]